MTKPGLNPGLLARYLQQQKELGGAELFLEELDREQALEMASKREGFQGGQDRPAGSGDPENTGSPPASGGTLPEGYDGLRAEALVCQRCALAKTRKNVVFSDGNPEARLMVVGEAPGAQEDKTGLAFVGPAGKLLDLLLASVGLSRADSAYICNVLKCRPPGNRNPLPEEIQECTPFLRSQIDVISPQAILAVGAFSGQFLTGKAEPLGRLRGEVYSYHGVPVVVTYHPAALLRNSGWTRATWDDLQLLRQVMDGE